MKKTYKMFILLLFIIICLNFQSININGETIDNDEMTSEIISENQIIVVIKPEYSKLSKDFDSTYFSDINCTSIDELTKSTYECIMNNINPNNTINISEFRRIFCLTLDIDTNDDINEIINQVKNKTEVEDVFPNFSIKYESTSHYETTNNYENNMWWYNGNHGISIEGAWNYTTGSDSVIVGVIDTGIDRYHDDLDSNLYSLNKDELHKDFVDYDNPCQNNALIDNIGHGTHVAGIIGSENDGKNIDDLEVIGVSPNVRLVSLKFSDNTETYSNNYIDANINKLIEIFEYAKCKGIFILNFSGRIWGDFEYTEYNKIYEYREMATKLMGYTLASYGGLLVCAAGNDGEYGSGLSINNTPAVYSMYSDRIITVGSIGEKGSASNFSRNDAQAVSIFAPGESIISTFPSNKEQFDYNISEESKIIHTIKDINGENTNYISLTGTSMATPFVTGTAALLTSVNPYLTSEQIKRTILENADYNIDLENKCFSEGSLNAYKAVCAVIFNTAIIDNEITIDGFTDYYKNNKSENCNKLMLPTQFSPYENINDSYGIGENPTSKQKIVSAIGIEAFKDNDHLEVIELPNTIKIINNSAFEGCNNLITVNLPNNIETLGSGVFKNCTSIESITLPNSISKISSSLFEGCTSLKEVIIPEGVTKIESSAFKGCTSLERIVLPSTVTWIESNAFEGCTSLEEIILPNTIGTIGEGAFNGCENLETIDLPSSLNYLNTNAFRNCINLKTVNVTKETYPIIELGTDVFTNCPMLTNINVSTDKIIKYKNAPNWSSYKNLINCNMEFDSIDICCNVNYNDNITIEKGRDKVIKLNIAFDYLYNFEINSYYELNIKIYDENFNELNHAFTYDDEYVYNIDVPLTEGIYYLDVWGTYDLSSPIFNMKINADIEFDGHELTYNTENNISNHLHFGELSYITYLKYTHKKTKGLYKLSLNEISSSALFDGSIKVYSDSTRTNIINCYNITNFDNLASTKINENALYLYLNYNTTYYIDITLGSKPSNLNIKIEKIPDVIDFSMFSLDNLMSNNPIEMLDESDDTSLNTSFFKKVNLKESGVYSFTLTYTGTQETDIKVLFIKDNGESGYSNIGIYTLNNSKTNIYTSYNIINKGTYYIGYYNLDKSICDNLNVSLRRFTDNGIDSVYNALLVDPNAPGMYGSQINIVERNQQSKSYGETFITKGFSRLIFIDNVYGYSNSRLDYEWHSSDTSILTVTQFGTVFGKGIGTAKIVAINKNDPSIIFIKEFTVIDNENEEEVVITIDQAYSLSSTDNCTLNLTVQNSPYPMIQYYYLAITNCTGEAELDAFGNITVSMPCEITIEGYYLLNSKYRVRINFVVTT